LNSDSVAWRGLIAEAAAIVLSILAAFSIDAWWDFRGELKEEAEVLVGLRAEFVEVADRLDGWATFNAVKADLVSRALAEDSRSLPDGAADSLISSMPYVNVLDRGGGSLEALLSSGRLELIRDRELRESLARWPDRLEDIHTNDLSVRGYVWGSVLPYMANRGVPDGVCSGAVPFCVHKEGLPESYHEMIADPSFRALLTHLGAAFAIIAADHRDARDTARALVRRIDDLLPP
jgi:hypothetical protein